jgi:hypothetical protein
MDLAGMEAPLKRAALFGGLPQPVAKPSEPSTLGTTIDFGANLGALCFPGVAGNPRASPRSAENTQITVVFAPSGGTRLTGPVNDYATGTEESPF